MAGTGPLGNAGNGVDIEDGSDDTLIGFRGASNVIAFNGGGGVAVGLDEAGFGVTGVSVEAVRRE